MTTSAERARRADRHDERVRPRLLEREADLARVESALDRAQAGHGDALVAWGPAGIGKTSLLGSARGAAEQRGFRVLRARAGELEQGFGFGVVRQLFEPLLAAATPAEQADWLTGAAGHAARLLDLPCGESVPAVEEATTDRRFLVLHGFYWLCVQLTTTEPLCLVVDDAHWADAASLKFLAFLLPRLEELPLVLLVAARRGEGAATPWLSQLIDDPATELVEMAPLSKDAVGRMLADGLGEVPEPELVDRCHRATGGVPLLVEELVRQLKEKGPTPQDVDAHLLEVLGGRAVERWVLQRIRGLGAPAVGLAEAVAVLEAGSLQLAAQLAALDPPSTASASDALTRAGVLATGRPLRFVHPVVRHAVYDAIGDARRATVHRRAAQLLVDGGAASETVAEHLLAAEPAADPWVVDQLRTAAAEATARGAPESAAAYLERGLLEPPRPNVRPELLLDLGLAKFHAGHADALVHLDQSVDAALSSEARTTAVTALAFAFGMAGRRFARSVQVLDDAMASLYTDDETLRQLVETMTMGMAVLDLDLTPAHRDRLAAARRRADAAEASQDVLALGCFLALVANEPASVVAALARRALNVEPAPLRDRWALPRPGLLQIAGTLVFAEHEDEAMPLIDLLLREARTRFSADVASAITSFRGLAALHRGDLRGAEADVCGALENLGLVAPDLFRTLNSAIAVESLTEQGRLDDAEQVLASAEVTLRNAHLPMLYLSRGRLRHAQRRPDDALADVLAVRDVSARVGWRSPAWLPWRSQAALAYLTLGDVDGARELAQDELELAQAFGAPRTLGVALAAVGITHGGARGEAALREAVGLFTQAGDELGRARALCDLGAQLRRGNRRSESRGLLREALDVAHPLGAGPLAQRAETELRATGARPRRVVLRGADALTASERRIAELAAEGMTNREIGQTLFVTARTVEGHLTAVFRKLQVDSRDHLPSALRSPPGS